MTNGWRAVQVAALLSLAMAPVGTSLAADAPACSVPAGIAPAPAQPPKPGEVSHGGPITHYVFAFTWAPEFCRTHGNSASASSECADRSRGFVVHGLWPNSDTKPYPRFCADAPPLDQATLVRAWCLSPSASLLQHEWAAHGTCGWPTAAAFFGEEQVLRNALVLPDLDRMPIQNAGDVRAAFVASNPSLAPREIAVATDRKQRLTEIRVCYGRDLHPTACVRGEQGAPDRVPVRVTPRG